MPINTQALHEAAQLGDGVAQLQLGIALMTGEGVPTQDLEQARSWLTKSADNGNHDAQRFLGMIFLRGMDVVPDEDKAVSFLESAADAGDSEAGFVLSSFLGGSRDQWFDVDRARRYLEQAARAGHPRAQAHLGYSLVAGFLGKKDPEAGLSWFIKAAGHGDAGAMLALAEFCLYGFMLPKNLSRAYWLARKASNSGWLVAGEFANSLVDGTSPPAPGVLIPEANEISSVHTGTIPAPDFEVVSWEPRAFSIRNFASSFECAEIANTASLHVMPSFVLNQDGNYATDVIRTSKEVRLRPGIRHIVINAVERREALWSQLPLENGEYPLVLRYEKGQFFGEHFDYFIPEMFAMGEGPLEFGGQRITTHLLYLNDEFTGGETRFDAVDLAVRPERGMSVIFHDIKPNHNIDPLTRHTGVAVETGVKWMMARWVREIPHDQPIRDIERDQYRQD